MYGRCPVTVIVGPKINISVPLTSCIGVCIAFTQTLCSILATFERHFGNLRVGQSRSSSDSFQSRRVDTNSILQRGESLHPDKIAKDNRYLISEMACKSLDASGTHDNELKAVLTNLYDRHSEEGGGDITARQLLTGAYERGDYSEQQLQFDLSADDILNVVLRSRRDLEESIDRVTREFDRARGLALNNTEVYLSMVGDLDVYVATSMRTREDFRKMGDFCEAVFDHPSLSDFNLTYFDPTLSAAANHEDKGLIECLMVKCATVLILSAGKSDSYGKDAEAAMALSLGKPVIIHASEEYRSRFFRDVHPLSRLVDFKTGVTNGAMIATTEEQVVELLRRIFCNSVEYELHQPRLDYLVLREKLTQSVVRLQTSDDLLRETFANHYH